MQAFFNTRAAQARVGVEQTFGMLKSRFPALRSLGHKLRTRQHQALAHSMIISACVFHNLLLDISEEIEIDQEDEEHNGLVRHDEELGDNQRLQDRSQRRELLVDEMLAIDNGETDLEALDGM